MGNSGCSPPAPLPPAAVSSTLELVGDLGKHPFQRVTFRGGVGGGKVETRVQKISQG